MDQVIALKRSGHGVDALEQFQTNRGKALMDEANVFFSGLLDGAEARQSAGIEGQRVTATWQRLASIAGTIIIIAVVIAAVLVLTRYTRELRRVSDEVTSLNTDLEQRVQDRTQDLVSARDRATALLSEVNHRVANSLTLVSSLVGMQSRAVNDETARSALAETQDRIYAISLVHKRLYASGEVGVVQLEDYLSGLLDHLRTSLRGGNDVSLTYHIAPVALATDRSISLGVILTEWVTNAYKYAYPDGSGEVRVSLRALDGGLLQMIVEDDGVGSVDGAPAKGTGVGTRIVKAMAVSMEGRVENLPRERGTAVSLTVPHKT
jgi:two-component sensor histidine kinase